MKRLRHSFIIKRTLTRLILGLAAAACGLMAAGCGVSQAEGPEARPDVIVIDAMKTLGSLDRNPVEFPHDFHTAAILNDSTDCQVCHKLTEDGRLSLKFMRLTDDGYDAVRDVYHDNCIGCHKRREEAGLTFGPQTCGGCHVRENPFVSSWQEINFDKSLHYRHIQATQDSCGLCHHQYNDTTKQLVYVKGQETFCRDCHGAEAMEKVIAYGQAAHTNCVGCHRTREHAGPMVCAGCHDAQRQALIARIENPPRLKRNQPDFLLLNAPEDELADSKLATVPFSHVAHEGFLPSCRSCHHQSLLACNKCHRLETTVEGGGVTLQQAMHRMTSEHSCIGCHNDAKAVQQCSGCHDLMEQGRLSEHACPICHTGPKPDIVNAVRAKYSSLDQFRKRKTEMQLSFQISDIPDTVTVGRLSDKYEPAKMPHRKIVQTLMADVSKNKIATHFHGHEDVICQGCHHHTPIGAKPPLCESCHGKPFDENDPYKPGLYGAYHRQCLGCHESMDLSAPDKCVGCHRAKSDNPDAITTWPNQAGEK